MTATEDCQLLSFSSSLSGHRGLASKRRQRHDLQETRRSRGSDRGRSAFIGRSAFVNRGFFPNRRFAFFPHRRFGAPFFGAGAFGVALAASSCWTWVPTDFGWQQVWACDSGWGGGGWGWGDTERL